MDDRILFLPLPWTPDPAVYEKWPASRALLSRLRSFLPVDTVIWPTLKGQEVVGDTQDCMANALRARLRPEHHVLSVVSSNWLLEVLGETRARSLVASGFFPSPSVMAARGDTTLASAMLGTLSVFLNPTQFMRVVMTGADDFVIEQAARDVRLTFDRDLLERIWADPRTNDRPPRTLSIPTLYLTLPVRTPGADEVFAYFRSVVPGARHDELHEWGFHLQEETGGHELADKVIAFIEEVIAARG
jgi:hypothetical protein